jgi:hypothetical protein
VPFTTEDGHEQREFDLARLPVADELQVVRVRSIG